MLGKLFALIHVWLFFLNLFFPCLWAFFSKVTVLNTIPTVPSVSYMEIISAVQRCYSKKSAAFRVIVAVFSIMESATFRMFVSGLNCGESFTIMFLLNFNARTFSRGRFQLWRALHRYVFIKFQCSDLIQWPRSLLLQRCFKFGLSISLIDDEEKLGNCVITCREAYQRCFLYHFLKGLAPPQGDTHSQNYNKVVQLQRSSNLFLRRFTTVSMSRIFLHGLEWILGICQGISFIEPRWDRFSFMIYMEF